MAQGVQAEDLRSSSIWGRSGSNTAEEQKSSGDLLRWLVFIPLILLLIFGCGSLALIQTAPASADTRSHIAADYQPWEFTVFKPIDEDIIEEIQQDQLLYPETFEEPVQPVVAPGSFWDPTETPTPGEPTPTPTTPTQAPTSTQSLTPTVLASATPTVTVTSSLTPSATPTPSGPPPPVPPAGPPANTYWFQRDTSPLSYMMYTTLPNGIYRSGASPTFHSSAFSLGQSLQAGTTTVNFYGSNPSSLASIFSVELRAGDTQIGHGSFALPANTYDAYFFSASIATSQYDFTDGDRLDLRFNFGGSGEIYWDGPYNYSGVAIPAIVNLPTDTPTPTASASPTITGTPTSTGTVTNTPSPAPTNTSTGTPVPPTNTPLPTSTPTDTPVPPTATPTNTPVPPTPTPTNTPVPPTATPTNTPVPTWWDASWLNRIKITFDNSAQTEDLTNFPVLVSLTSAQIDYAKTQNAGQDIRFIDADDTTELNYEIEQWDEAGTSAVWVKVLQIDGSSSTDYIWMYYNNSAASDNQNVAGTWSNAYAGVWHLDEATDATNIDSTSNANNGTPIGSPVASTGQIAGALDFNVPGDATRVEIPADASLNLSDLPLYDNWTLSAWVKPTSYGGGIKWPTAYGYGHATTLGLTVKEAKDPDPPFEGSIEHWRNDASHTQGDTAVDFNAWNHIAVVRDPTTTYFYWNGAADGTVGSVTIDPSALDSSIGSSSTYPIEDDFLGLIDEVRVSNAARSADWMAAQHESMNGTFNTFGSEETAP